MDHLLTRRSATGLLLAGVCNAAKELSFDVVSFKHTANMNDGSWVEDGRRYFRPIRKLEYKGRRLAGEEPLAGFLYFAFSPLVKPWQTRGYPAWMGSEYYEIQALAPAGTNLDGVRAMLRTVLAERLALQYHFEERETPVYFLRCDSGQWKLPRASESETDPGRMQMGKYIRKSASIEDFASWLSGLAGRPVVDRTATEGQFRFDVDWSQQVQGSMRDPSVTLTQVKKLGLKLESGKEMRKVMVVDHLNQTPSPN